MSGAPLRLDPLDVAHDAARFNSGSEPLNRYPREQVTHDIRRRVAACFVALADRQRIAGHYTLASASLLVAELSDSTGKKLPRYPSGVDPVPWTHHALCSRSRFEYQTSTRPQKWVNSNSTASLDSGLHFDLGPKILRKTACLASCHVFGRSPFVSRASNISLIKGPSTTLADRSLSSSS